MLSFSTIHLTSLKMGGIITFSKKCGCKFFCSRFKAIESATEARRRRANLILCVFAPLWQVCTGTIFLTVSKKSQPSSQKAVFQNQCCKQYRHDVHHFYQRVDSRTGSILRRVAHGIAHDGGCMRRVLAAVGKFLSSKIP